jgi:AbrB family looped-hinge helix DNA binding protein
MFDIIPYMSTITLTSKGQLTIPVEARVSLGLKQGDRLTYRLNHNTNVLELSQRISSYAKNTAAPVLSVSEYYTANRRAT